MLPDTYIDVKLGFHPHEVKRFWSHGIVRIGYKATDFTNRLWLHGVARRMVMRLGVEINHVENKL